MSIFKNWSEYQVIIKGFSGAELKIFTIAIPALAHDSLIFKNLEKNVEARIIGIHDSTKKQVFIAYDT